MKDVAKDETVDAILFVVIGTKSRARCEILGKDGADLGRILPLVVAVLQEPQGEVN